MNIKKIVLYGKILFLLSGCSYIAQAKEKTIATKGPSWTFMVYMAAANDLEIFAPRNLRQMEKIGSNSHINIVAQHNIYEKSKPYSTTYFIEKGSKKIIKEEKEAGDSGHMQTLIDFCCNTMATYPADHYALILWNHGTGILEPVTRSHVSISEIFSLTDMPVFFNEEYKSFPSLPLLAKSIKQHIYKGICFNDSSGNFLNEQQLITALKTICATSLNGKKLDLLGFDACLMSMVEVALSIEPYVDIMVASQDVERGTGWDYYYALYPFLSTTVTPEQLGIHLVHAYAKAYKKTSDFTQTCLNLKNISPLTENISRVAFLLQDFLKSNIIIKIKNLIKMSRNRHLCTHFDEPEFIDLYHFYDNLLTNLAKIPEKTELNMAELNRELEQGKIMIQQSVLENMAGSAYPHAHGISIYFPEHIIHNSYRRSLFAKNTNWAVFLKTYLSACKNSRYTT